jgi:hypothetical protein
VIAVQVYTTDRTPNRAHLCCFASERVPAHRNFVVDYHLNSNAREGGEWPFVCQSVEQQQNSARSAGPKIGCGCSPLFFALLSFT